MQNRLLLFDRILDHSCTGFQQSVGLESAFLVKHMSPSFVVQTHDGDPVRVLNKSNKPQKSTSSLSTVTLLAIALLLGRAALITETEELLGDVPTLTALMIFLAAGAAVMRFDFIEFSKATVAISLNYSIDLNCSEINMRFCQDF